MNALGSSFSVTGLARSARLHTVLGAIALTLMAGLPLAHAQQADGQPRAVDALEATPATTSEALPAAEPAEASTTATFEQEMEPAEPQAVLPHDLSPWGMFMAADWVVKAVMIGLALASVLTWTVWLAKTLELAQARRRAEAALVTLAQAGSLAEAARLVQDKKRPATQLVHAAVLEAEMSSDILGEGLKERVASRLERIEAAAGRQISKGTGILASIGSTAPFVGLFGTVWGIMNSFIGISKAQTTNLAVVAPGIAEALLATAIGLVAAIPAVLFYNGFSRSIGGFRALLGDAAAEVMRLVSRDLDRRTLTPSRAEA